MQIRLQLPNDPPGMPDALRAALDFTVEALVTGEAAMLPGIPGLDSGVLARWLYRAWLESRAEWRPLIRLAAGRSLDAMRSDIAGAPGALVHVSAGLRAATLMSLAAAAGAAGAALLIDDDAQISVPPLWVDRLRALDAQHLVATDPALAATRASLLAGARRGGLLLISGPAGSGRRDLVAWAHARLDDQPLSLVTQTTPARPPDDRWAVFEEVAELDDLSRAALRERAGQRYTPVPPPPAAAGARPPHPAFAPIIGESAALCAVLQDAAVVAPSDLPVLILGEPGVGKELLARAIHEASGRTGPLVTVDISSLGEGLIASELFGHIKGAYTGADRDRPGAFRSADGGTLFLDELGNIPLPTQAMLLRALQEGEVRPVGSDRVMKVNVRVITATNADLNGMVQRGSFRADLLSRVAGRTLRLPPLRERRDDILLLAGRLLAAARGDRVLRAPWASPEAEAAMLAWPWSTNIRELSNVMRWVAAQTAPGERVERSHLGVVAPSDRRVCTFVTIQEDPADADAFPGLDRRLVATLRASALRLPSLDARGPRSIRHAALTLLDGHPIAEDALALLCGRSWPGNLPQLSATVAALQVEGPDGIDAAAVLRHLPPPATDAEPQPLAATWTASIRVLMDPTVGPSGEIQGNIQDFAARDLLIGRGHGLRQLEEDARRDPAGAYAARAAAIRAVVEGEPDTLRVRNQPLLSRAHLLLRQRDGIIEVMEIPDVGVPVLAGGLDQPGRARVSAHRPTAIGAACEVQLQRPGDAIPVLQLFAFANEEAWQRWSRATVARATTESAVAATAQHQVEANSDGPATTGRRVWPLNADEAALLQEVILAFPGGDFQAHVRSTLHSAPRSSGFSPAAARLSAYLTGANVPTAQYAARLYQHNPDAAAALNAALDDETRAALPGQLRRALQQFSKA